MDLADIERKAKEAFLPFLGKPVGQDSMSALEVALCNKLSAKHVSAIDYTGGKVRCVATFCKRQPVVIEFSSVRVFA